METENWVEATTTVTSGTNFTPFTAEEWYEEHQDDLAPYNPPSAYIKEKCTKAQENRRIQVSKTFVEKCEILYQNIMSDVANIFMG